MPLACDFIGFVNVEHTNFNKPDEKDLDHCAVNLKLSGDLDGDVLAKLKGCQPVDVADLWFPEHQDEEQHPRFENEVKTALSNIYEDHYLILNDRQFRADIKKIEFQLIKQKRITLNFSAAIDPVSEEEILMLVRMLKGWAKCKIEYDADLVQEAEEALAGAIREQQEQMEY